MILFSSSWVFAFLSCSLAFKISSTKFISSSTMFLFLEFIFGIGKFSRACLLY
ncbi:hypothetical protein ACL9WK_001665 [Campylobacter jejuni]